MLGNLDNWPINEVSISDFPIVTTKISNCPKKLYYRGKWNSTLFEKSITIVGSRQVTKYGRQAIEKLVPLLVKEKITVISGFMYGVDIECHQQCLLANGKTVAIVGGGLNSVTRTYNEKLYSEILDNGGLLISEYEPNFKPTVWSFPQRDRLMSALATLGVLVVEGGISSGSLITAKYALKQGKPVFAIPGPINSKVSEGTNWLIKTGAAKMVTELGDILVDYSSSPVQRTMFKDYSGLTNEERMIISVLENESATIDELKTLLKLPVEILNRVVTTLVMRGLVEEEMGKIYLS